MPAACPSQNYAVPPNPAPNPLAVQRPAPRALPSAPHAVNPADCWDLASLYPDDSAWEAAFAQWSTLFDGYHKFQGQLAQSPATLADCLRFDAELDRTGERLGTYAFLKTSEDQADSPSQRMKGRYTHAATQAAEASSFIRPEIMAIPPETMEAFLDSPRARRMEARRSTACSAIARTRSAREEQLLAMQGQMSEASSQIFRQLNDADLKWGIIQDEKGEPRRARAFLLLGIPPVPRSPRAQAGVSRLLHAI